MNLILLLKKAFRMATLKAKQPYFPHDLSAAEDMKLKKVIKKYGYEGYGLFWRIVEFMHKNELSVGDEDLVVESETEKIICILNDFGLFYTQNGVYQNDRINRNIAEIEEKSNKAKNAIETRWIMSAFKKVYVEILGQEPYLGEDEIKKLKKYATTVNNFSNKLPDIIYSLTKLNFKTDITFKPCASWLLTGNNLLRLLNGEFGELKSWQAEKSRRKAEEKQKIKNKEPIEELNYEQFKTKEDAIELILKNTKKLGFINPLYKPLMSRFNITVQELEKLKNA